MTATIKDRSVEPQTGSHTRAIDAASWRSTFDSTWQPVFGVLVWLACLPWAVADLTTASLLFAPLVIVPLGLACVETIAKGDAESSGYRMARLIRLPAALLLVFALATPTGGWSSLLAAPWAVFTLIMAAWGGMRIVRRMMRGELMAADQLCVDVGMLFVAVGGGWAMLFCLGRWPLGFQTIIAQLTAVHFHYIGAGLMVLIAEVVRRGNHANQLRRTSNAMAGAVIASVPLLALGITFSPLLEVLSAVVLVVACVVVAVVQMCIAWQSRRPMVLTLLSVSSLSLIGAMTLAAIYAVGEVTGIEWISIPEMIPLHGVMNAFGSVLCGLIGWRLLGGELSSESREQKAES